MNTVLLWTCDEGNLANLILFIASIVQFDFLNEKYYTKRKSKQVCYSNKLVHYKSLLPLVIYHPTIKKLVTNYQLTSD